MGKLYYFEGRNTGIYANSASEARKKKTMRNGGWSRVRKDGKSPEKSSYGKGRGQGPPR